MCVSLSSCWKPKSQEGNKCFVPELKNVVSVFRDSYAYERFHISISYAIRCVWQSGVYVFDISRLRPHFAPTLPHLRCVYVTDIPSMPFCIALCVVISLCYSFFVVAYVMLEYIISGKRLQWKRLEYRVLSNIASSKYFTTMKMNQKEK